MRYVNWGVVSRHLARTYFLIKLSFLFSLFLSLLLIIIITRTFIFLYIVITTRDEGSTPELFRSRAFLRASPPICRSKVGFDGFSKGGRKKKEREVFDF